jgi:hypothetical protein
MKVTMFATNFIGSVSIATIWHYASIVSCYIKWQSCHTPLKEYTAMNRCLVTLILNGIEKAPRWGMKYWAWPLIYLAAWKLHKGLNSDVRQSLDEILTRVTTVPSCNLSFLGVSSYPKIRGRTMRHAAQYTMPTNITPIPTRQYLHIYV